MNTRNKNSKSGAVVKLFALYLLLVGAVAQAQKPLENYLQTATENNPGLRAEYNAFEAEMQQAAQARGLPNPTLSFGYFIKPVETRIGPQQARFSLSQMFPWFGSLAARGDAAAAQAQAQYIQFVDAREKLKSRVKIQYHQLWQIRELIELEKENLRILKSYKEMATTRVSSGDAILADVYRVEMEMKESQNEIETLQDQLATSRKKFNRLLNRQADASVEIADTLTPPKVQLKPSSAESHPQVSRYQTLQESSQYDLTAAQKRGWPQIGVGIDYVVVGERSAAVPDNGQDAVMPMLSVSLPIWRKQYRAARQQARLRQKEYENRAAAQRNELQSEKDETRFALQRARDRLKLYREQLSLVQKTLELTTTAYANDREDFEEVLRLQQKQLKYKRKHLKAYGNLLDELARMKYLEFTIE